MEITKGQAIQFNHMLSVLGKIANNYQSTDELKENSEDEYGLEYEEALEMAYENIQGEAAFCIKNIKPIHIQ